MASYPDDVVDISAPSIDDGGIGRSVALIEKAVYRHLVDSRTFREGDEDDDGVSMLGSEQRATIEAFLNSHAEAVHVVAVPEPMEKWRNFIDFKWLIDWAVRRHIAVICGGIHDYHYVGYKANGKKDWGAKDEAVLHEFAASAMAQGPTVFGKKKDVFEALDFGNDEIVVKLFHAGREAERYSINVGNWKISNQD